MSEALIKDMLKSIRDELGGHANYFDISHHETLADDADYLSVLIEFKPKQRELPDDMVICGSPQYLEFVHEFDGPYFDLIIGEDTAIPPSKENIYSALYWGETIKEKADSELQQELQSLREENARLQAKVQSWKSIAEECSVAQTKIEACEIYEKALQQEGE
jgi:hypothetical protein